MSNKVEEKAMKSVAKGALVPKLRFPEFRNAGGWEEKRLGDACERIMDGTHFSPKTKTGPRLYLTSKNIQNGTLYTSNVFYISEEEHRQIYEKCPVRKNDVLLTKDGANTGNCAINSIDDEFSLLSSVAVLRGYPLLLEQRFLYQTILSYKIQRIIQESMSGQAITRITLEKIGNFIISIASIEEQQKIADCLSSLDEQITLEDEKLKTLKAHKKGLMQQLFPAKGETVPKLRFPEFRDAGEWEEKRLGDVGSVRMCKRIFKEQTSPRGDIPFYKIGTFGGVPDAYISREIYEIYRNNFPFPKRGSVLISAAGTIGRTILYKGELAYFQDSNIVWLDNNESLIADNFLFYLYQLINWAPSVGAIQRLYNENILGSQVKFPSIPEQQKIADCLSSLDELITAQTEKLKMLKAHKKGLMQQLFPAQEAVSA